MHIWRDLIQLFSSLFHTPFCALGNYQLTDSSWNALCSSSRGLRRLHAAECCRMTDASLKSVASLKHLQYLDISHCSKCVFMCVYSCSLKFHAFFFYISWHNAFQGDWRWDAVFDQRLLSHQTARAECQSLQSHHWHLCHEDCTEVHTAAAKAHSHLRASDLLFPAFCCCVSNMSGCADCSISIWVTVRGWRTRLWSGWVAAFSAHLTSVVATSRIRFRLRTWSHLHAFLKTSGCFGHLPVTWCLCFQGLATLEGIPLKKLVIAQCVSVTDTGIKVHIYLEMNP